MNLLVRGSIRASRFVTFLSLLLLLSPQIDPADNQEALGKHGKMKTFRVN